MCPMGQTSIIVHLVTASGVHASKIFFKVKGKGYRNGTQRKNKIGMGYESLHIIWNYSSVQSLLQGP